MTQYDAKVALLGGIIDYAGTFPPAALPLDQALAKAATFRRTGRHPWLMGKIAYPLTEIRNLTPRLLYGAGADGSAWVFTALGGKPDGPAFSDFAKTIEWELREVSRLNERSEFASLRSQIVAYEIKLPEKWEGIESVLDRVQELDLGPIDIYFEVDAAMISSGAYVAFAENLAEWLGEQNRPRVYPGIKVRVGGQSPPKPEELGRIVVETVGCGLHFKATQGLHAATTHGDSFGFVNLFGALALAQALGREEFGIKKATQCLLESKPAAFVFSRDEFKWQDFSLTTEEIESARRRHHASFGSCSVDEPDEFLTKEFP